MRAAPDLLRQDIRGGAALCPGVDGQDLFTALGRRSVGDQLTVTIYRLGETLKVPVTLEADAPAPN